MAGTKENKVVDSVIVTVIGRIGRNPEIHETRTGKRISNAPIAIGQRKKNTAGHWEDGEPIWLKLVAFGSDLDQVEKGDRVKAIGKLAMQTWEDKEGNERKTYEVLVNELSLLGKPKPKQDTEVEGDDAFPE